MDKPKKKTSYFYIDDDFVAAESVTMNLNSNELAVLVHEAKKWQTTLFDILLAKQSEFDGLILDWNLDGEGDMADFSSESLAQQCRRLQVPQEQETEHKVLKRFNKSFPIILCSAQEKFAQIFEKDSTASDLFDGVFSKSELGDKQLFLIELHHAYQKLSETPSGDEVFWASQILGLSADELNKTQYEFVEKIKETRNRLPFETVRFMLTEAINVSGVLINEKILAARLGIDIHCSAWKDVLKEFEPLKYKGILSGSNERWWAGRLEDWWIESFNDGELKFQSAKQRSKHLENKFPDLKGKLAPPPLAEGAKSDEFWTVCLGNDAPLAEIDGFQIKKHRHYDWQDPLFVSFETVRNEDKKELWPLGLTFHEEKRFSKTKNKIKSIYGEKE